MHGTKQTKVVDEIVLQTILAILNNGNRRLIVNALLDDSNNNKKKTYVYSDIAAERNL